MRLQKLVKMATASTCAIAVSFSAAGVANASELNNSSGITAESSRVSDVNESDINAVANDLELLFTRYVVEQDDTYFVDKIAVEADGHQEGILDMYKLAAALNAPATDNLGSSNGMQPFSIDYTKCIINASGLGGLVGVFKGA